jgi:hypothetical protein
MHHREHRKTTLTFSFDEFGRFLDAGRCCRGRVEHQDGN